MLKELIKFIDFLLRPENAKLVVEKMGFSMPNEGVKALLSPEMANNPTLFPSAENIEKGIMQGDVGEASGHLRKNIGIN